MATAGFWLGGETSLVHWHLGVSHNFPIAGLKSNSGQEGVEALAAGPDGSLWIGILASGPGLGLGRLTGNIFTPFVTPTFNGSTVSVNYMLFDHDGNLWVGTVGDGIFRIKGNAVDHYGHNDGLSSNSVDALFEDREGIVWAVTPSGVDSFRDPSVTTFSASEGLGTSLGVREVAASKDGTIWVGDDNTLGHITKDGIRTIRSGHGLPGTAVTALFEDRDANLWVGVDNQLYLLRNRQFRSVPGFNLEPIGRVFGIAQDVNGDIWATCAENPPKLVRIRDFRVREQFAAPNPPAGSALASDPRGGVWMTIRSGEIAWFRNGTIQSRFPINPGGDPASHSILAEADGSVFASSENGLIIWQRNQLHRLTTKNGLPCNRIVSFIQGQNKIWWLYASCGLIELQDYELRKWLTNPSVSVHTHVFDIFDGVQPPLYPGHLPAASSSDGRIWFASGVVVQLIDPSRLVPKALSAPTHIDALIVDRGERALRANLRLPPNPRDLQINYTSPTFSVPQNVRFRYRLDGYDHDWIEAGTRRQAFYADLGPGNYSFRVIACNSDGIWNNRAATLQFTIARAYYQTNWFRALCAGLLLASLWAAYQWRVQQLHRQFEVALEARVAERTRIARELHDTLLQSAQGLLLCFQTVSQLLSERRQEAKQQLDSAIQQTANFIAEARDEVQGLRDDKPDEADLATEINALAETLLGNEVSAQPKFQITVEGESRLIRPLVRDEVFKICAEALRNAYQHAAATQIEVDIRYTRDEFRVRVRDNGKGIHPEVLEREDTKGHYGLPGMRERAALIGSNLTIWSAIDSGTEVELRVPKAFVKRQQRWWLPQRNKARNSPPE